MGVIKSVLLKGSLIGIAAACVASISIGTAVQAEPIGAITEYTVPTAAADPSSIVEGPDGAMWFIESTARKIAKMEKTGGFTEYPVSSPLPSPGGISGSLVRGADGRLWFGDAGVNQEAVLKAITTSGEITSYPLGASIGSLGAITDGPGNEIWFTTANSTDSGTTSVLRSITTAGVLTTKNVQLNGIVTALAPDYADGGMWYARKDVALPGSGPQNPQAVIGKLAVNGTTKEYVAGTSSWLYFIAKGVDGNLWYTDGSKVGVVTSDLMNSDIYEISDLNVALRGITAGPDGYMWAAMPNTSRVVRISTTGTTTEYAMPDGTGGPFWITKASDGNVWFTEPGGANQIGKVGTGATGNPEHADSDYDGLTADKEALQNTSDQNKDTDNDGLSDLTESVWFGNRDAVFCKNTTCEYPNPLRRDIYVEVDWMDHPGSFYGWGSYSMKLTDTQITPIKAAFNRQGISLHIDNGQLGGGNQIAYKNVIEFDASADKVDFYDYKLGNDDISQQFSPLRHRIFHYAIMGDRYQDVGTTGNSGVSRISDDDFFVAYGAMKSNSWQYTSFDTAIAGTFMHELGHNLCLMNTSTPKPYPELPSSCMFDGIDAKDYVTHPFTKYYSSMNYSKQKTYVDYSSGVNGVGDHDDWSAIRLSDFVSSTLGDQNH